MVVMPITNARTLPKVLKRQGKAKEHERCAYDIERNIVDKIKSRIISRLKEQDIGGSVRTLLAATRMRMIASK